MAIQLHGAQADQNWETLYSFIAARPHGVTTEELKEKGNWDVGYIMAGVNKLLGCGRLEITRHKDERYFRAVAPHIAKKFAGLDAQHMLINQLIEKEGDRGAWSKTLQRDSNLAQPTVTRILKELMARQLIKEVKSQEGRKKVYMKFDIRPAAMFGGTFVHDGEFRAAVVEDLRERCLQFLQDHSGKPVTLQEVHQYVLQAQGKRVSEEEIAGIMRTLELDEEIVLKQTAVGLVYLPRGRHMGQTFDVFAGRMPNFMVRGQMEPEPAGLVVPCLSCPLREECCIGGRISPTSCEYIAAWLTGGLKGVEMDIEDTHYGN